MIPAAVTGRTRWRIAALAAVAAFLLLIGRFRHPVYGFTPLLQLDASNDDVKIAAFRDLPVYVYRNTGGYDGLYYAQIAYHPLLNSPELPASSDNLAYRARRILPPALAWLLAAGRPALIVYVYSVLNVAVWLVFAALLWRILGVASAAAWLAWALLLFSAGAIASVRLALPDLPAAALMTGALWAAERNRGGLASGLMAAAGLSRETVLAAVPGLWRRPWFSAANLGRTVIAVAPLAAWIAYVRWRVGPADPGWSNFDWPLAGLIGKGAECVGAFAGTVDTSVVVATCLATIGLVVQAVYIAVRPQPGDPWWRAGAAHAFMMTLLGEPVWEDFPGAAARVLLPLTIAFNVLAVRRKAAFTWLIAGNLGVVAGLLALREPPNDPREIAAASGGGSSVIARVGDGWFDREHRAGHVWAWSSGRGKLLLEAWPPSRRPIQLVFGIRSLDARTVTVREHGRVAWQGVAGRDPATHSALVTLEAGKAELDFSTDRPPLREDPALGGRPLAFAIYDLRIAPPGP
jgi:hypothetical protein